MNTHVYPLALWAAIDKLCMWRKEAVWIHSGSSGHCRYYRIFYLHKIKNFYCSFAEDLAIQIRLTNRWSLRLLQVLQVFRKLSGEVSIREIWYLFCNFWIFVSRQVCYGSSFRGTSENFRPHHTPQRKVWHAYSNMQHLSFSKIKTVICNINKPNKSAVKAT